MSGSWPIAILFAIGALAGLTYAQAHGSDSAAQSAVATDATRAVIVAVSALVLQSAAIGAALWVFVSIPIAVIQAYRKKLAELRDAHRGLALERQRNTPNVRGNLWSPVYMPLRGLTRLGIIFPMTLTNQHPAAPSALTMWRVSVTKNGVERFYTPDRLSQGLAISTATGQLLLEPGDDITAKSSTVIEPGAIVGGYLAVVVPDETTASIDGAILSAHFVDVSGVAHRINITADTKSLTPNMGVLAGTNARFVMTPNAIQEMTFGPPDKKKQWATLAIRIALSIASDFLSRKS